MDDIFVLSRHGGLFTRLVDRQLGRERQRRADRYHAQYSLPLVQILDSFRLHLSHAHHSRAFPH